MLTSCQLTVLVKKINPNPSLCKKSLPIIMLYDPRAFVMCTSYVMVAVGFNSCNWNCILTVLFVLNLPPTATHRSLAGLGHRCVTYCSSIIDAPAPESRSALVSLL